MEMGMTSKLRNTGIGPVGYRPWGTHFCNFYATKTDLVEVLAPYFKAGLENKEFCIWVLSEPVTEPEAWNALREAIPELDEYRADGSIEIFHAREWYLKHGIFDMERVSRAWNDKLNRALDRGYEGMRVSGDTAWLERKDWSSLCHYERVLNDSVVDQKMTVLCTYPMATNGAADLLDVISTHQFAVAMRNGSWQLIETRKLKQVEAEISRSLPGRKWTSTSLSRGETDNPKMPNCGRSYTELPSLKQIWNLSLNEYLKREKLPGSAPSA